VLKPLRWLVLSLVLVAGCGTIPAASLPTPAANPPASSPATKPVGQAPASPAAPLSPVPSPSPSPSPSPTPRTTVRLGTTSSLGGWVLDVAEKQGMLTAQGIILDRKESDPGSAVGAEQVDTRETDIGVVSTDRLVQAGRNGQALVMVAGLVNKSTHTLIAARDVQDFAGLKGKPVGHLDAKSASAAILKRMLKAKNIAEADAPLLTFPDPGVVGAAVANGTVGASLVDPARAGRLRNSGFKVLAEANDVVQDFQAEGLVVRPEWARQNEDTLVRVLRATVLAERWIMTPSNKPAAVEQLARSLSIEPPEAIIVYAQYVEKLSAIPREGDMDPAGVRGVVELLAEIDAAGSPRPDPARLTDTTYLQRAKGTLPR
jgi:ABC-type nitrate/sulfonate/bicarbonate transport system substrate-binding protein